MESCDVVSGRSIARLLGRIDAQVTNVVAVNACRRHLLESLRQKALSGVMFELAVALVLIVINGIFSLSELAIVSSRKVRLKTLAAEGRRGAAAALALAENPGRFLSTVQIGITLVGVLAGAFSGAALGQRLSQELRALGLSDSAADWIGYGGVIGVITYLSVVIGELLPKNIALRHAEAIACRMARADGVAIHSGHAGGLAARRVDEADLAVRRPGQRASVLGHR